MLFAVNLRVLHDLLRQNFIRVMPGSSYVARIVNACLHPLYDDFVICCMYIVTETAQVQLFVLCMYIVGLTQFGISLTCVNHDR